MGRTLEQIVSHIKSVISNPNIQTTLIQTEDLELLCNMVSMIPLPIETAPTDLDEILLVSFQPQDDGSTYISICNGSWSEKEQIFVIGKRGSVLNEVGDGCATHWLPKGAVRDLP